MYEVHLKDQIKGNIKDKIKGNVKAHVMGYVKDYVCGVITFSLILKSVQYFVKVFVE